MIFPICLPYHPIFGERKCEVYLLYSFKDAFRFSYERTVFLPPASETTFTDIYTYRAFYGISDFQTVGFNFSSGNLVGSAYTERVIYENYGFGFSGKYKWFSVEVLKGKRGEEEKAYFLNLSGWVFSITGGWDGGPSFGATLGNRFFLRGAYYSSLDTFWGVGLGFMWENLRAHLMGGRGILGEISIKFSNFQILGNYNRTLKLNSGILTFKYDEILGFSLVGGRRIWGDKVVNSPEFQGKVSLKNPIFSAYSGGAIILKDTYRISGGAILNFLRYKDAIRFYPKIEAYYEENGRVWINGGIDAIFYGDLRIGVFYEMWVNDRWIRLEISWRLWD